jgi:hypothetical protein
MRKNEIPKAKDNDLITEYINAYATLLLNYNANLGTKQLEQMCKNLEAELLKREILTEENIARLNK